MSIHVKGCSSPPGNYGTQGVSLNTQGLSKKANLKARGSDITPFRVVSSERAVFNFFNTNVALRRNQSLTRLKSTTAQCFVCIN